MTGGARALALALALGLLPACRETGDFGRVKRSGWNEAVTATGSASAFLRGEPASGFPLTDDEVQLRERAWRFLVPADGRLTLDRLLAELVATGILPASASAPDLRAYGDELIEGESRSPASRYRRLMADVSADATLIAPLAGTAARVLGADRGRGQAAARFAGATPDDLADAQARIASNRCLVAWVRAATNFRAFSYADALGRLTLAAPGP